MGRDTTPHNPTDTQTFATEFKKQAIQVFKYLGILVCTITKLIQVIGVAYYLPLVLQQHQNKYISWSTVEMSKIVQLLYI